MHTDKCLSGHTGLIMRQVIVGCLGVTQLGGLVVYLCFLLLSPPAKWHYRDITMHSVHFGGQES